MRYEQPLLDGTVTARPKRAVAQVKLKSGEHIWAHYVTPGSLRGCSDVGSRVLMSVQDDPHRLYKHQIEVAYAGRVAVGVHAARPAAVAIEALSQGRIPAVMGYATLRRERKAQRHPSIDFQLEGNGLRTCHVVVRGITYAHDGVGYTPDAKVPGGVQALTALTDLVREGNRVMLLFFAQRNDVKSCRPADNVDADYCMALRDAVARGVEALCYRTTVSRRGIELDTEIPIELNE